MSLRNELFAALQSDSPDHEIPMPDIPWPDYYDRLVQETKKAIEQFAHEHPNETVSYFAYYAQPASGRVSLFFDTPENSLQSVKAAEKRWSESVRGRRLESPVFHAGAYTTMVRNSALPFSTDTSRFKFRGYAHIDFPDWEEITEREDYPEPPEVPGQTDYLSGWAAKFMWCAIHELAEDGTFEKLDLASPTMLGFDIDEGSQIIVRLMNLG